MTPENMKQYRNSKWYPFWQNLKTGYDLFSKTGIPPNVNVKDKKYVFN
jgi:murein L,D-transpeptidase YafK